MSTADIAAAESDLAIRRLIDRVDSDRNPVAAANEFFQLLYSEEFLDDKITLSAGVPLDSVRQMVYYSIIRPGSGILPISSMSWPGSMV